MFPRSRREAPRFIPVAAGVKSAPYGAWKSPFTSDLIVAESVTLLDVLIDGTDIYWIEGRPREEGRNVLVKHIPNHAAEDITPAGFNARTRVHEYGGGAVTIKNGVVYFTNFADQQLYRQDASTQPIRISSGNNCRYADAVVDVRRNRLVCIREDHSTSSVVNTIVEVAVTQGGGERIVASGSDFYSNARLNPDGSKMAWIAWNHPNMPWTSSQLWLADVSESGDIVSPRAITASSGESIFQPEWSPTGVLHFISDRTGWWNLYRVDNDAISPVFPMAAEFGEAQFFLGMSTYGFVPDGRLVCSFREKGVSRLGIVNVDGKLDLIPSTYREFSELRVREDCVCMRAGAPDKPASIVKLNLSNQTVEVLRRSSEVMEDSTLQAYVSIPTLLEFPSGERKAYVWFYRPLNPDFTTSGELPPLIVRSHGGPTAAASSTLDLRIQYWTSRGFAVADVDYGGSTGYGRAYRDLLYRSWGVVDLEDCTNAAKFLTAEKYADTQRVAITGGSAGGYTTLCALTFDTFFRIGASYYGIGNLEALAQDTHKFESHYLEWLVGKYPDEIEIYRRRSPIHFTERLSVPIIFFQGNQDQIVPPNQTEQMVAAVRAKGLPLGYLLFYGEQHGFRKGDNIKRALDAELYFYSSLLVRSGLTY
jgi:dipeptidyl aminopeptidase/acylaminoacyl peptidase